MIYPVFFNAKNSLNLFGLEENLKFLLNLYNKKKLPKVLMLSGAKGSGKSTLINHFLFSIFDSDNYNEKNFNLSINSSFLKQFKNNIFSNIIYINGSDFKSIKIDDIRDLKNKISKSAILNKDRFIILNNIELFNHNSLNALLKIIEEPSENNYFILINNKSKPLLETVKSRTLEIKIILSEIQRLEIIENLINLYDLELILEPKSSKLTPGDFVKFNHICNEYKILPANDLIDNITLLLDLYKKNKDILFINLVFFTINYYFNNLIEKKGFKKEKIYEMRNYIFNNLNNFMVYNINQKSLLNILDKKLNNE